jgi:hypothetical protein
VSARVARNNPMINMSSPPDPDPADDPPPF